MAWTDENKNKAIELILDQISSGYSLKSIIDTRNRDEVPAYSTFMLWLDEDKELSDKYARACEERADKLFDELIEIADDRSNDYTKTDKGISFNSEHVQRSKLRIETRQWALSRMNAKKYGNKIQQEHSGEIKTTPIVGMQITNGETN